MNYIKDFLLQYGFKVEITGYLAYAILVLFIFIICLITNIILINVVLKILTSIISKNKTKWDDILLNRKVFHRLIGLVPAIIVYIFAPAFNGFQIIIRRSASTYILIVLLFVISSVLDSINDIYKTHPISKVRPIKGLLQVIKIITYIIIGIVVIANLMGESPLILLSGIGALAAVFSFVFKDSILGFIAGIQLTSNDMLRIGDWIEMAKYGADGDVIDITLNTVKVQNFDKTIVSIPAYALVSDSFKNWRGMTEFGARRMKRSIYIDVNSIGFCTPQMIDKFRSIYYLKNYITEKENEIKEYNQSFGEDEVLLINGRHLTNIGTFRIYIQYYLKNHPELHDNMAQLVRQLAPGENGLPLEIYAFIKNTNWEHYEGIQSDIFDHILSVAGEFGLRIFQNPTGFDVKQINSGTSDGSKE
ncbi:MAG: putative rane protein [Herbinix sp.]|jgi:miniconductance mechanosensitive channel|nr:putative rane protein [Herbinix sp.]